MGRFKFFKFSFKMAFYFYWVLIGFGFFSQLSAQTSQIPRDILIFWDSSEYDSPDYSFSAPHEYLEAILNYYGLKAKYFDVDKDFKDEGKKFASGKFLGALSWFSDDKMRFPQEYLNFISLNVLGKIPFLIFGNIGLPIAKESSDKTVSFQQLRMALAKIKLNLTGNYFPQPAILKPSKSYDPKLVEFERKLEGELAPLIGIQMPGSETAIWLEVEDSLTNSKTVAIGFNPLGGVVQAGYGLAIDEKLNRVQWRINPFELIKSMFVKFGYPVPDTTTICGKRIFWAHLDGDSFFSISELDRKSYNGEIFEKEILERYKLPHTVSIIESEISSDLLGNERLKNSAKRIFQNPLVEPASHTFSHPLSWEKNPSPKEIEEYLGKNKKMKNGQILAYNFDGYKLNYQREIKGSLDYINNILQPRTPAKMLLWSGSCMPPLEALKVVQSNGYLNMNGGDSRFDSLFPSYAYVSPLYREVGGQIQVYSGNANENIYTNFWEGPFGGFEKVVETFENTEAPYRIRPINIYYHFYSLEKESSFKALRKAYDYLNGKDIYPLFASDYVKLINNFIDVQYQQNGNQHFYISGANSLKTFRFDDFPGTPDYKRSHNVVGHQIINNSLYVFLGNEIDATIILGNTRAENFLDEKCKGGE